MKHDNVYTSKDLEKQTKPFTFHRRDGIMIPVDNQGFYMDRKLAEEVVKGLIDYLDNADFEVIDRRNKETLREYLDEMNEEVENENKEVKRRKRVKGYVYLLKADNGLTKIGMTKELGQRMTHFTTKLPYGIEMIATIKTNDYRELESVLHDKFSKVRKNGEWFDLSDSDIEYVKSKYKVDIVDKDKFYL